MKYLYLIIFTVIFKFNASAKTDKYRLIWNSNPHSSITIAWCKIDGLGAKVHYGELSQIKDGENYPLQQEVTRKTLFLDLRSRFARLTGLKPNTEYAFVIRDDNSESRQFTFKTASKGNDKFSFVAGGDSRNNQAARQNANRAVAKIRPLFVCFGGDMISTPTNKNWSNWLDDWQLTTGKDGRMIPIVAARGNHEGASDIHQLFDTPHPGDYYAFGLGNKFLRVYTLNSCIVRAGDQGEWLKNDLKINNSYKWKIAHYHHPFRPHHKSKAEQNSQYDAWAQAFYDNGMNLVIECDSHMVKRTWPVRPSKEQGSDQGFIRDDENGITFIGEGCWGAPLRKNDDDKQWTRASDSFNQVNWMVVSEEKITVRSVKVDNIQNSKMVTDDNPFETPEGMEIWSPDSGKIVNVLPRKLKIQEDQAAQN